MKISLAICLSTIILFMSSLHADQEKVVGPVLGDCWGVVICNAGGSRRCQTNILQTGARTSICTRHFGGQAWVLCQEFDSAGNVVHSDKQVCP